MVLLNLLQRTLGNACEITTFLTNQVKVTTENTILSNSKKNTFTSISLGRNYFLYFAAIYSIYIN